MHDLDAGDAMSWPPDDPHRVVFFALWYWRARRDVVQANGRLNLGRVGRLASPGLASLVNLHTQDGQSLASAGTLAAWLTPTSLRDSGGRFSDALWQVRASGAHGSWRRAVMLALVRSERSADTSNRAAPTWVNVTPRFLPVCRREPPERKPGRPHNQRLDVSGSARLGC